MRRQDPSLKAFIMDPKHPAAFNRVPNDVNDITKQSSSDVFTKWNSKASLDYDNVHEGTSGISKEESYSERSAINDDADVEDKQDDRYQEGIVSISNFGYPCITFFI
uniref:AGC-kinase C-terminal domain-containing protein n=1 Tax=Syphacia muris TaxID=451379 RepID=A0A0N5ATP3_9BILA